jgi:glycosyltransferase involved in cell wall biosynthesis
VSRRRILALEPYYGGSHRAVLDLLVEHVDADWTLLTLPARKWKWRMRGSAITMAEQARAFAATGEPAPWDLIFASTFLNLAEFRGLCGHEIAALPAAVYFHENQLSYPNRHTAEWDLQFPLTNITTALSAEVCVFNTQWNRDEFLQRIEGFIRQFPDHHPADLSGMIAPKTRVISPPFDPIPFDAAPIVRGARCRIVWPHRWEHDKNPEEFFAAVMQLADENLDFEVAVAGQSFRETDELMRAAARCLGSRLVFCDEPSTREEYAQLLGSSDVAVSTAVNEFFGLAMVEACYAGCSPVVPDRLAYTELYEPRFRYSEPGQLTSLLRAHVLNRPVPGSARALAERYTIGSLSEEFSTLFDLMTS